MCWPHWLHYQFLYSGMIKQLHELKNSSCWNRCIQAFDYVSAEKKENWKFAGLLYITKIKFTCVSVGFRWWGLEAQARWEAPCADTKCLDRGWSMKSLVFPHSINIYAVILWPVVGLGLGARGKLKRCPLMTSSYSANRDNHFGLPKLRPPKDMSLRLRHNWNSKRRKCKRVFMIHNFENSESWEDKAGNT